MGKEKFMEIAKVRYDGNLRTSATHLRSGNQFITDAPPDNNGKGEAFSPTDMVSTALASCMMTIMGIVAEREGIDMTGLHASVDKEMASNPRKIARVGLHFEWDNCKATAAERAKLKKAGLTCPVALSLHPDLKQDVVFNF